MMDRLTIGLTLGHQAFAVTTADANPVYDITLFGLLAQLLCFAGSGGAGRCSMESWQYCQQWTLSRRRIRSACFFCHRSWMYLYAPILAHLIADAKRKKEAFLPENF